MSIPLNFCLLYTGELQFIMIFAFLATLAGLDSDEDISGKAAFYYYELRNFSGKKIAFLWCCLIFF